MHAIDKGFTFISTFQEPLVVVDVGGPHSKPINDAMGSKNVTKSSVNKTVSVVKFMPTVHPTFLPEVDNEEEDIENVVPAEKETNELLPERPIILYIGRGHTGPKARVMKVLPALVALKHKEKYSIINGNSDGLFTLNEHHGVASLKFTRKVQKRMTYKLEILCEPLQKDILTEEHHKLNLEPFAIHMEVHIL